MDVYGIQMMCDLVAVLTCGRTLLELYGRVWHSDYPLGVHARVWHSDYPPAMTVEVHGRVLISDYPPRP